MPAATTDMTAVDRRWIERIYRRDLQFLVGRMSDTIVGEVPAYAGLQAAAAKCAAMARHPEDSLLRTRALEESARAIAAVEAYIERLGDGAIVSPPRVRVQFG